MDYIKICEWDKFQHYKKRNPPWIKLHTQLLENDEIECLQDDSKWLLICLWLYTARKGNGQIKANTKHLLKHLPILKKPNLQPLIDNGFIEVYHDASKVQATDASKVLVLDRDRDRGETEERQRFVPPTISQINEYCQEKNIYVNAQKFINHYGMKGWAVGKSKMKNWKLAVSNAADWDCNRDKQPPPKADPKVDAERLEKKQQEIRDKDGSYFRGQTTEKLKIMLKTPALTMKHWLIKEILQERKGGRNVQL